MSDLTLIANPASLVIAGAGTELTDSRRYVDLLDRQAVRVQFKATLGISVRVEYSLDEGASWAALVSEDAYVGSNPYVSGWQVIPDEARTVNVLLRALGLGGGVLTTVNFVEMQYR